MRILYSFNKEAFEAEHWESEILAASDGEFSFVPFNHGLYLSPNLYLDASSLDRLYQNKDSRLQKMYKDMQATLSEQNLSALLVNNCPPYHPEFLRDLNVYKVLYSGDDPVATYLRNIPYLHAYDHVFFASPTYSPDLDMQEKMRYCGMVNADWLPIGVFDYEYETSRTEHNILSRERDIDIIYVGKFWRQKIQVLADVAKAFGRQFSIYGMFGIRHNLYINVIKGARSWVRPLSFPDRVSHYQRAKIGINIHWSNYALGNQRLYHLPANGVMQLSDCSKDLHRVFSDGEEVVGYSSTEDLIEKLRFYLSHKEEREAIALGGYRRVMREYRLRDVLRRAGRLMQRGMERTVGARSGALSALLP